MSVLFYIQGGLKFTEGKDHCGRPDGMVNNSKAIYDSTKAFLLFDRRIADARALMSGPISTMAQTCWGIHEGQVSIQG